MKKSLLILICLAGLLSSAHLKAAEQNIPLLINGLARMFSEVKSLEYTSTREIEIHTDSFNRNDYQMGVLSWRNSGDNFYYKIVPLNRNGVVRTVAFDGTYSQILEEKEWVLYLDSSKFKTLPGSMANDLFLPFLFFPLSEIGALPFSDSPMTTVFNPKAWEGLIATAKKVGVAAPGGITCAVLEFPGPPFNDANDLTVFRVYLSDSSTVRGFPVQWELLNKERKPLIRYLVSSIGEAAIPGGLTFLYPETAIKQNFGLGTTESPLMSEPISTIRPCS